jgi:hypothetical protein
MFKTLQTYAGGNVVRWISVPGTDHPAPRQRAGVDLTGA